MKTLNFKTTSDIFSKFTLTSNEMIKVRGGDAGGPEPTILSSDPPVKI
ncbi:MAG: hypothetical protein ABSA76_07080 [Bacteroidales bacterium]